jgi:hypothetical protein
MFKVGQKVVYVQRDLPGIGLIKGKVYEVLAVEFCCEQSIDVGIVHTGPFTYCGQCGAIINIDDRNFISHDWFRPLVEVTIEQWLTGTE